MDRRYPREFGHVTVCRFGRLSATGHGGGVLALQILGALVLVALLWVGLRLLLAGRQLDRLTPEGSTRIPVAPRGSVAAKVDGRLQRTRAAVETLVMPEVEREELHPSVGAFRDRAQTYVVLGAGLLGLGVALVAGLLLVL
jgi:hypothetical protein